MSSMTTYFGPILQHHRQLYWYSLRGTKKVNGQLYWDSLRGTNNVNYAQKVMDEKDIAKHILYSTGLLGGTMRDIGH
jgi:hypothetical protein